MPFGILCFCRFVSVILSVFVLLLFRHLHSAGFAALILSVLFLSVSVGLFLSVFTVYASLYIRTPAPVERGFFPDVLALKS